MNKIEEKIYTINSDTIDYSLESFFKEVYTRREDNQEGGLQASIVILKDSLGAKVCENEGLGPHTQSHINVIKYLKGKDDYLAISDLRNPTLYHEEQLELSKNGIDGRIISNSHELKVVLFGEDVILSQFQKQMLIDILEICRKLRDDHYYDSVSVGISLEEASMEYGELDDDKVLDFKKELNMYYKK